MSKPIKTINTELAQKGKTDIKAARSRDVYKANDLVQRRRFELSAMEQKIIAYMVSLIKEEHKEFKYVDAAITDLCVLMGIDETSGKNMKALKTAIRKLASKAEWVEVDRDGERCETLVRWIEKPTIHYKSGFVRIKLDEDLKPYLIGLENRYTVYELENILGMKSKYGIRLFELCKSYQSQGFFEMKLTELKEVLCAENYVKWAEFKRNVLDMAISEINRLSDTYVYWKPRIKGRSTYSVVFCVRQKKGLDQARETKKAREDELNKYLDRQEAKQIEFDDTALSDKSLEDFHDFYADALPLTETEKHAADVMFEKIAEKKTARKRAK